MTVGELAHEWLAWLRDVKQIKPSTCRKMLGHAKLSPTDRYGAAKYRPEEFARLDAAFARP